MQHGITVRGLSAHASASHAAGLYASRALVGLGEGVAPSGATDMVARVIAKNERARAISFIFSGLHVGSLLGLLVAPPLIENFGWETVFYIFGVAGGSGQKVQCYCWPVTFCILQCSWAYQAHRGGLALCRVKVSAMYPAGLAWVLWFQSVMRGIEQREPEVARALLEPAQDCLTASNPQACTFERQMTW